MRELGFRVWSNYWKKFATEAELHMDGSVDAIFEDADGVPHHDNADLAVEFKTTIKDKNGKEIYEGDIIDDGFSHIGKVFFNQTISAFVFEFVVDDNIVGSTFVDLYTRDIEVIGNIHENPELLADTNVTNKEEE